jgi:predicted ABC-type ATPase
MSQDVILIAGANGAGKTTFARQFIRVQFPEAVFLNVDEIQREDPAFVHPVAAGKELLHRVAERQDQGRSFAIETTLSSRMYAHRIPVWIDLGYHITLHFIELPSADFAVQRVAQRVSAGGHAVPEVDIRRRFRRGRELFETLYKGLVHEWYHWVSDEGGLRVVDRYEEG